MKRQDRTPELYFYEWSVSSWRGSDTRHQLDSAGRGIFREMLDLCYTQGSIAKDRRILASQCGCTEAEIEAIWPVISKHFFTKKSDPSRLENARSNMVRKQFFGFVKEQRARGKKGGEVKANGRLGLSSGGLSGRQNKVVAKERRGEERIEEERRGEERGNNARQQRPPGFQEEPDPARLFDEIYARHPYQGKIVEAQYEWTELLGISVNPTAVMSDVDGKHKVWCEYWRANRGKYVPYLHEWIKDRKYLQDPIVKPINDPRESAKRSLGIV